AQTTTIEDWSMEYKYELISQTNHYHPQANQQPAQALAPSSTTTTSSALPSNRLNFSLTLTPTASITMSFFKSNKSTASAATTPAQTPRSSMQGQRLVQIQKMTPEQSLEYLMTKTMSNAAAGSYVR
ncbi:hypothetical protein BGW38_000429, partial [Lunasporangiospora selenospora]